MALPAPTDKARFVRSMFDSIAARYDLMNRLMTGGQDEAWRRLAADAVYPEAIRLAVDVGAGTGDLTVALARLAPQAHVVSLDFSPEMLRLGAEKLARAGLDGRTQPVLGDAMSLPLATESVEAIVTGFTIRNVSDISSAFREAHRALRAGGRLAVLELTPTDVPVFSSLFQLYFRWFVPLVGSLLSRGYAYRYLPASVLQFPSADRLRDLLLEAGFTHVGFRKLALGTVALHVAEKAAAEPAEGHRQGGRREPLAVEEVHDAAAWDDLVAGLPSANLMQSWEWGEVRRETAWSAHRLAFRRGGKVVAAAQVLRRRVPFVPLGFAYCPRGPVLDYANAQLLQDVLRWLAQDAWRHRCFFLKVDPDVEWTNHAAAGALRDAGFAPAPSQVQTRSTVINRVDADDETLLGRMSATWRRYIHKAERDGVSIRPGAADDLDRFYELMRETGERDGFFIRPRAYYERVWRTFGGAGMAELFVAEVDGRVEAAVLATQFGKRSWYLYGASSGAGQKSRAAYLLQWRAMLWARERGCETYDMFGAPDDPRDKSDPLSGVYYFKRGFGGRHVRWLGAYDYSPVPALYALWNAALPRGFALLRRLRGERSVGLG